MISFKHLSAKLLGAASVGALAILAPAALVLPAAPAAAQSNAQLDQAQLDRAVSALRGITTMRADFTQSDRTGQTVSGTLTIKNPGRIRFQYSDDVNMLVVSNGATLTLVDYDVQQVERYPIRNSPLGALLDPQRDVARYGRVVPTNSAGVVSISVNDPDRPEFPQMTLIFVESPAAPGGLQLASWVALDAQNSRTTVRLRNHRYGMAVADSNFTYRDPRRAGRRP
ncbi:MAG TPA: outer membrane lipoprotein carrier protein LolA [Paracoccaceae bacterium]|nr:outer membrane lipoprotein carrier protein LolA [Paracoccaceae bacterium]